LAVLIILLLSIPSVLSFTWYGLSNRPIVDYTFGQATDVRVTYSLIATNRTNPGTIDITHILVRNRGSAEITVIVTVHAVNAVISTSYGGPYSDMAGEQITLPANSGYRVVTYYLTLITQVPGFMLQVEVSIVGDYSSLESTVATLFGDITPTFPTLLQYAQQPTIPYEYQLRN
jgi:hypothetical protein